MAIAIRQLQKHFVGEVSGLDLRKPLTRARSPKSPPTSAWTPPTWNSTAPTKPKSPTPR